MTATESSSAWSLPLFSWLAKDEEVVQARIESYYGSIEASKKNIANQVAEAFRSVKEAGKYRSRVDSAITSYSKQNEAKAKRLEASDDLAAKEDLRYEIASERDKSYEYLIEADRLYNQSLIRLERALGADLDQVLKVEIQPLAAVSGSDEVTAAAVASSGAAVPRAKPVPKKILLDSQKKNSGEVQPSSDSPEPKGLFHRIGKPDSKADNSGSKRPSKLKKFRNR